MFILRGGHQLFYAAGRSWSALAMGLLCWSHRGVCSGAEQSQVTEKMLYISFRPVKHVPWMPGMGRKKVPWKDPS